MREIVQRDVLGLYCRKVLGAAIRSGDTVLNRYHAKLALHTLSVLANPCSTPGMSASGLQRRIWWKTGEVTAYQLVEKHEGRGRHTYVLYWDGQVRVLVLYNTVY
jgi:hypothetical protein